MKTWQAIGLTIAIIVVGVYVSDVILWLVIAGTSVWMAVDSSKIGLRKYKSFISMNPVLLLVCGAMLWVVTFPCYLSIRYKIQNGGAQLKPEFVAG